MPARKVATTVLAALLLLCVLPGLLAYWWFDANLNPKPYADDSLRRYLAAVQAEDWATATSRVDTGTPEETQANLRAEWSRCVATHGRIADFDVRGKFFGPETAIATIRFAGGTVDRWEVQLNARRGPGWKLIATLPPSCPRQP
ncbi:MAG TPA: hypothetical protein VIL85_15865 [Thermomicrobiales bacterium]